MKKHDLALDNPLAQISIRPMSRNELLMVMSWAEKEGWNPGVYDYLGYYALDNDGLLLLLDDQKPVGAISVIKYSAAFAFIGLFMVLPEYRKQGYGTHLWKAAMSVVAGCTSVGLYAVPKEISRYQQADFKENYFNNRWKMFESKSEDVSHLIDFNEDSVLMYKELLKYDYGLWKGSREKFFNEMLVQPSVFAFISFEKESRKINGYGMVRPCQKGYRIGPLYADDFENAKLLARVLFSCIPSGSEVIFDIPTKNSFSQMFGEFFKLSRIESSDTEMMFKGRWDSRSEEICYGVSSLEIG